MRYALCHPDRRHFAKDLCHACYQATYWRQRVARRPTPLPRGPAPKAVTVRVPDDPATLGYIAGLLDGEGNLTSSRQRADGSYAQWRMTISNTHRPMMEWLLGLVGGRLSEVSRPGPRRTIYTWRVTNGLDVHALLTALLPHLMIKREKATRALADITDWLERHRR